MSYVYSLGDCGPRWWVFAFNAYVILFVVFWVLLFCVGFVYCVCGFWFEISVRICCEC